MLASRIAGQIQAVREDADSRIQSAVERTNSLLEQIEGLRQSAQHYIDNARRYHSGLHKLA